jgi:hypothetical protein
MAYGLNVAGPGEESPRFPKHCGCGRVWSATTWQWLVYVGIMSDHIDRLELRHCVCGSTIAMHTWVVEKTRALG